MDTFQIPLPLPKMQYPCVICNEECTDGTIQCSDCEKWVHSTCVPMSAEDFNAWSDANMHFLCSSCCFTDHQFDHTKSLQRLSAVISAKPRDTRIAAKTEGLLLKTYGQTVPSVAVVDDNVPTDIVSQHILRKFHPMLLSDVYPAETTGDGNCFYRAVSRAVTGTEACYLLLRILTLIEILTFPWYYDSAHTKFVDLIQDNRIVVATYCQLAKDVGKIGAYADMMHMYALSAVLKLPIRSYYPPQHNAEFTSEPYTRKVCGRAVNESGVPACTIMWTSCFEPQHSILTPNHFVPLLKRQPLTEPTVITVDDDIENDDDDAEQIHITSFVKAEGVHPLSNGCLDNAFLESHETIRLLTTCTYSDAHSSIPTGIKNGVYFVVQNSDNIAKREKGQHSTFSDDCGIWNRNKGSTPRTYFLVQPDGILKMIYKKGEQFCESKTVKGKKTFTPMDPQPASDSIFELIRNYSVLKKDSQYKRRVSWLGIGARASLALVEYLGQFPGLSQHGNGKDGTEYIRTPTSVMSEMSDLLLSENPLNVYNKLTLKHDELSGPRNRKQVYAKKYNDRKYQRKDENGHSLNRGNIADHINELDKMLADSDSIVKSIVRDNGKAPCVILYTEQQLEDLKKLCCTGQSILGIDKTFNLCDMHVTASCYKQTTVVMESTGEPPIFLGPVFVHDNSDFESYSTFFNHLMIKLINTDKDQLVIGSDEELALVNAIQTAFPEAGHILCMRHLRQNCKQKLTDDCIDKSDRDSILNDIFGTDGLIHADDIICFDAKCSAIEEKSKDLSSKFYRYFEKKLKNNLIDQWNENAPSGHFDTDWTNNNCESLNHMLKRAINWQSKPLLDLVTILRNIVDTQFKDLLRSLVSMGQYRIAESHLQFKVTKTAWMTKTVEERQRYFKRFRNFVPKDKKTATSTDGHLTVIKPMALGKKLGQRKRNITERTTSFNKMKEDI